MIVTASPLTDPNPTTDKETTLTDVQELQNPPLRALRVGALPFSQTGDLLVSLMISGICALAKLGRLIQPLTGPPRNPARRPLPVWRPSPSCTSSSSWPSEPPRSSGTSDLPL